MARPQGQPWYDVEWRIVLLGNPLVIYLNLVSGLLVLGFLARRAYWRRRGQRLQGGGGRGRRGDRTPEEERADATAVERGNVYVLFYPSLLFITGGWGAFI